MAHHTRLPVLAELRCRLAPCHRTNHRRHRVRNPEILVVCTHNAGRSVASRVLLDHYGHGRVVVRSAGSAPGDEINPAVAQVLAERGLDASQEFPKPLTDEAARAADVIITAGCGDACAVFPGKRYLDWDLPDPAGKSVEEVRPIVDEIDRRARALLAEMGIPEPDSGDGRTGSEKQ